MRPKTPVLVIPLLSFLAATSAAAQQVVVEDVLATGPAPIAYSETLEVADSTAPQIAALSYQAMPLDNLIAGVMSNIDRFGHDELAAARNIVRAHAPIGHANSIGGGPRGTLLPGGKLLLTNGITSVEGSSGGGIASWATIGGLQTDRGIGLTAHATAIELPDFGWRSFGASIGIADRLELSYSRNNFDTRDVGAALGLGEGYTFNQDVFGAKLRVLGDVVYGDTMLPQIAVGVEHKRNSDGPVLAVLGAGSDSGTDFTLSATKLFLEHSLLVNATARLTEANQLGLLGFGSASGEGYQLQFEGSLAYQLSRRAVVGAEYRSKPDNLGLGEDDWVDIFAAYALTNNITVSAAYVDLGSIATFEDQRGGFVQAQIAF